MKGRSMSRREAVAASVGVAAALAGLAAVAVDGEAYVHAGHIKVGDVAARNVSHVTLDGKPILGVFECHDVEGWLVRYAYDVVDTTKLGDEHIRRRMNVRQQRLSGVVRVYWKPSV